MGNYITAFIVPSLLSLPVVMLWLLAHPNWLKESVLPNNRLVFTLLCAVVWCLIGVTIVMCYDFVHEPNLAERLTAGLGMLVFGVGFAYVFRGEIKK